MKSAIMATSTLLPLILLYFLVATASGRPCKTLFYFSTATTTTYYPSNSLDRNPNNPNYLQIRNPRLITIVFTTTAAPRFPKPHPHLHLNLNQFNKNPQSSSSDFPLNFYSSISSSIRDRSLDILSVVGALLFGVGCGALTAAVMYSLWALFNYRGDDIDEVSSSSDDDADEDVIAAKKLGYVSIPTQAKMFDDDLKKAARPAKEVV